jgi:hypothetical protein
MTMLSNPIRTRLCWFLISANGWLSIGNAQTLNTPPQAAAEQAPVPARPTAISSLKVFVLEGADGVHIPKTGTSMPLVIEVRDQNDRPIEGADVMFQLPSSGPGGFFYDQKLVFTTKTNYQGQAEAAGFQPNAQYGRFNITVTVSLGALKRTIGVPQTITDNPEQLVTKRRSRKWLWIGLAGAAAAGIGIYFATRGSGGAPSSTVILTPGPITIGVPR